MPALDPSVSESDRRALVGSQFLALRPRVVGVALPLLVTAVALSGAARAQLVAVACWASLILAAFVWEARRAARAPLGALWLHRSLLLTTLALTGTCWLTGGAVSPVLPLLFAPVVAQTAAFGASREARRAMVATLASVLVLAFLPQPWPELALPTRRVAILVTVGVSLVLVWSAVTTLVDAHAHAARAVRAERDLALIASRDRIRTLETLGGQLAHELKNPLAAVSALAQLLEKRASDERDVERWSTLRGELERLAGTVQGHARFARPLDLAQRQDDDLAEVARAAARLLAGKADARGVALVVTTTPTPLAVDRARLVDALTSLLDNALDATAPEGEVRLHVASDAHATRLTITDGGPGLDPFELARVGTPYYTTKPEGNGLGVALARNVVEAHAGRLVLESEPGAGTTVTLIWQRGSA